MTSPRSCRSPGGHASTARGPEPRSQPARRPSRRPRSRFEAKCSCATEISPRSQPVAELVQERQDDAGQHGSRGVVGEQAVERGVRGGVVELLECAAELGSGSRRRRDLRQAQVAPSAACLAASAADRPVASSSRIRRTRWTSSSE